MTSLLRCTFSERGGQSPTHKIRAVHRTAHLMLAGVLLLALGSLQLLAADALPEQQVNSALAYLAKQQNADGSFDGGGPRCAMTGLTLMAFLANGHAPDMGKYGLVVRSATEFLLRQAPQDGYFGRVDGSRMYGQGIITLALVEAYGADHDPARRKRTRTVLDAAVQVILKAQQVPKDANNAGGWRYEPGSGDSDLSLSGWNALALRAAQNAGMKVPKERVALAVDYVLKCFRADQNGFSYQPNNEPTPGLTGVGILNLILLDPADHPQTPLAAKYIVDHPVKVDTRFFYYYAYYTTQAAFQVGDTTWQSVWKVTQEQLLGQQMPDGGWPVSRTPEEPGRIYATSMATLTLSVPYRLLPIYQR